MKKNHKYEAWHHHALKKTFLVMRIVIVISLVCVMQSFALDSFTQNSKVSLSVKEMKLEDILMRIEDQTKYRFAYNKTEIDVDKSYSVDINNVEIKELLDKLFLNGVVHYNIIDRQIVLSSSKESSISQQQKSISGKVSDSSGAPLPGVSVVVKGTTTGVISDMDGKYTLLKVPENATLVFSFVGMKTQEIPVKGKTSIDIILVEDAIGIDEVVAIGYGTQKSVNLTYSVAKVKSEVMTNRSIARLDDALSGQLAGVTVRQGNGSPGTAPSVLIRGVNSINAGSGPLYVIDGLAVSDANIIGNLDMSAVESVEVLKDAAAAAIYGSRGSGGVVIITTKKGKKGELNVSYSGYAGVQTAEKMIDMLTGPQQRAMIKEAYEDVHGAGTFVDWNLPADESYNHLKEFFKTGSIQNHQIAMSSGSEKALFYGSVDYFNQDGIIEGAGFDRFTTRLNASFKLRENIEIGTSLEAGYSNKQASQTQGKGNALNHVLVHSAFVPLDLYQVDTYDATKAAPYENPLYALSVEGSRSLDRVNLIYDHTKRGQILSNTYLKIKLFDGLSFKTNFGLIYVDGDQRVFNPGNRWDATSAQRYTSVTTNWLSETTLDYTKSFKKHNISLLAGYTAQNEVAETSGITGTGYANGVVSTLNGASIYSSVSNNVGQWGLCSYLVRALYDYGDRYLFSASMRRDGSSRFGPNNRWGIFPSASVGWRVSNEQFFQVPAISLLKLRASWGQTGNNQIGNFDYLGLLSSTSAVFNGSVVSGYTINSSQVENPDLKWERNNSINLGFDLGLFDGRIQVSADYYKNRTSDLLLNVPLPTISGYSQGRQNTGEVVNKGIDMEITSSNISKGSFKWTTSFVLNINDNKVTKMNAPDAYILSGPYYAVNNITRVGDAIGSLYMWKADGIYNTQAELDADKVTYDSGTPRVGDLKIVDTNGDKIIDKNDRVVVGQPMAKYSFGLTNKIFYKNFDLSIFISGSGGNVIYNAAGREPGNFNVLSRAQNKYAYFADRWTPTNTDGKYPRVSGGSFPYSDGNAKQTTMDLYSGDYWRIKNLTLGYILKSEYLKKYVNNLRIYISAENLFLKDKFAVGFNPETNGPESTAATAINGAGMDYASFPNARSFTLGVNVNF